MKWEDILKVDIDIAEAKRLGIEFNQLEQASASMLNFESSIANELEAELLTGRQLNLEQARLAALKGDTLQLTKEIANQVGTISDFENMNVIARESLAQAFGMNKDQLAEMLLRQEAITANEQASKDLSYEQLQLARERAKETGNLGAALLEVQQEADLGKKFENSAKKLQDAFKQVALEVMPVVTKLADLLAGFLSSPLAKLAVGAAALASGGMMIASMMRGTMMRPMIVRDVSMGGSTGNRMGMFGGVTGTTKSGKALTAAQKRMVITKGGTRSLAAGRAARFAGSAGGGMMLGAAGAFAGGMIKENAESAAVAGLGGALSMAGTGAMMGSMIAPGIGTAVGAGIGAVVGGITSYMEKSQKMQEEAQKKRDEEFQSFVKDAMMKEAKVYMDSNQVGTSLVLGHNYQVQ